MHQQSFIFTLLFFILHSVSYGQRLNSTQVAFLQENAVLLTYDSSTSVNWQSIDSALKDHKVVFLGEPNHGSKEIFVLRNQLIRHLHEVLDFKVLLLESGIAEVMAADLHKHHLSPEEMTRSLFGNWRTTEFRDLMAYCKSNDLSIAGFDVQRTGTIFNRVLEKVIASCGSGAQNYLDIESRFGTVQRKLRQKNVLYDSVKAITNRLIEDYQDLSGLISNKSLASDRETMDYMLQTMTNRVEYLRFMLAFVQDRDWRKRFATRDSMMAINIEWLAKHQFPDEKLLVVAHNYHIAKFNRKEQVMGEFLLRNQFDTFYTLGFFAGGGSYADNNGKEKQCTPPDSNKLDIKSIIEALAGSTHFLPMPTAQKAGSEWLHKDIIINDSFINLNGSNELILSKHFDGLIFIEHISPPDK